MKRFALMAVFLAGVLALSVEAQGPVRNFFANRRSGQGYCDGNGNCYDGNGNLVSFPSATPAGAQTPAPKAMKSAVAPKQGPLVREFVRLRLASELHKKGYSYLEAHSAANGVSDAMIDGAFQACSATAGAASPVGALGDGTILQLIIDFFKSPGGQQLLAAIIQMLIHLVTGL